MKILQVGEKLLEKKSVDVTDFSSQKFKQTAEKLLKLCKKYAEHTAGIAAPQIGINENIIVIRRVDLEEKSKRRLLKKDLWEVIVNPKILKLGKRKSLFWEGCLSVSDGKVFGPVERPSLVKISYFDQFGKKKTLVGREYLSHIIQHEIDHLNGILFIKYVDKAENLWEMGKLDRYIDKNGQLPEPI